MSKTSAFEASQTRHVESHGGAAPSRMRVFLRGAVLDFALCLVASVALTLTVSFGFESAPDLRGNIALVSGLSAVMLLILFAGSWSKRALVPSAIATVVYAVAAIAGVSALPGGGEALFVDGSINDVAGNYTVFGIVAMVVPVVTYLLSRRRIGTLVLLLMGAMACEAVQFLYRDWVASENGIAVFVVALVALMALFVFQGYRTSIYGARHLSRTSFGPATFVSVGLSIVCVGVGVLLFVGIIANIGLSTPQVKPFKDYFIRPVIEYSGVYSEQATDSQDVYTNQVNEQHNDSQDDAEGGSTTEVPNEEATEGGKPQAAQTEEQMVLDNDDWSEEFDPINYQMMVLSGALVAIPIIAAIVAIVMLWRRRRLWRLKKIESEPLAYRVWFLYRFLVSRFERLGFKKAENLTLMEYAMAQRVNMLPFTKDTGGVDFLAVTLAYQRACFDEGRVSEDDYQLVERYYRAFFGNAREYVGRVRWLWYFWRI